jgi:hypothetical protein
MSTKVTKALLLARQKREKKQRTTREEVSRKRTTVKSTVASLCTLIRIYCTDCTYYDFLETSTTLSPKRIRLRRYVQD